MITLRRLLHPSYQHINVRLQIDQALPGRTEILKSQEENGKKKNTGRCYGLNCISSQKIHLNPNPGTLEHETKYS